MCWLKSPCMQQSVSGTILEFYLHQSHEVHSNTDYINAHPEIVSIALSRNNNFPNSDLPVLVYRKAFLLNDQSVRPDETARSVFEAHEWSNAWVNGIYGFHHYHSNTHECMCMCSGWVKVMLGGPKGKRLQLEQGDVLILPAGTGHKCVDAAADFMCVGAYPQGHDYDIMRGKKTELESSLDHIKKSEQPQQDPVYGKDGFLKSFWKFL